MTKKEFRFVLEQGEGQFIEFKKSLDKSLAKEMVAFANAQGGKILVGITDSSNVKGIEVTNVLKSQITDIAKNCEPSINVSIITYESILIIEVKEGRNKPYSCSQGFFLRIGANSQKLKRDEIKEFFQEEGGIIFDEKFVDFDFEDLSNEAYNKFLAKANIGGNLEQKQLLSNLRFLKKNKLNYSGVLFFAKDIKKYLPNATIQCIIYQGTTRTNIIDKKEFSNDLISNYENALNYIKANLRTEFVIRSIEREEYLELPEVALREALINAIAHRDYFSHAIILVNIFYDRLEIINPVIMDPAIKFEDLYSGTFPRNLFLFGNMERINFVERAGSGFMRIEKAMDEYKLPFPEVRFSKRLFEVVFKRPNLQTDSYRTRVVKGRNIEKELEKTIQKTTTKLEQEFERLGKRLGEKFGKKLGENKIKIIYFMKKDKFITIIKLSDKLNISTTAIEKDIKKLKGEGIIKRIGSAKGGHWEVIE